MQPQHSWFQNRIVIAVLGALVVGVISARIAVQVVQPPASAASVNSGQSTATATATTTAPVSSAVMVQGTVTSIDFRDNSFSLQQNNGTTTSVQVNDRTQFGGELGFYSDIQTGMSVQVQGTQQADGSIIASSVTAQDD